MHWRRFVVVVRFFRVHRRYIRYIGASRFAQVEYYFAFPEILKMSIFHFFEFPDIFKNPLPLRTRIVLVRWRAKVLG